MAFSLSEAYASINKIWRNFKYHDGRGGDAHPVVSKFNAGFMSPQQRTDLLNAQGYKQQLPAGTNVFDMPAGIWDCAGAINNPIGPEDKTQTEYEVHISSDNKRKVIFATHSVNGNRWYRTVHFDGTPESGTGEWKRVYPEQKIMWKGLQSGGTISLSENLNNFRIVEIGYDTGQGLGVVQYTGDNKKISYKISGCGFNNNVSGKTAYIYECTLDASSGTSISISRNAGIVIGSGGVTDKEINNQVSIMHVIGTKTSLI